MDSYFIEIGPETTINTLAGVLRNIAGVADIDVLDSGSLTFTVDDESTLRADVIGGSPRSLDIYKISGGEDTPELHEYTKLFSRIEAALF